MLFKNLESATVTRKNRKILNRLFTGISLLLVFFQVSGQSADKDAKQQTWKAEKEYLRYERQKNYEGPDDWYGGSPSSIKESDEDVYSGSNNNGSQGIQYNPQRIQQDREKQYGPYEQGGGKGDLELDPKVQRPDPIEFPEFDPPDAPDIDLDLPDIDAPNIPMGFWKIVLFLIIAAFVVFLLYYWLKNRMPSEKSVVQDVENDWNPEIVTKSELELRLEEALSREDYREGIRIYFTFILKELIRKNWIHWKKDKTNHHYLMEMAAKPKVDRFRECVRIYDLVWYGEYEINKEVFEMLQPTLLNYYRSLEAAND